MARALSFLIRYFSNYYTLHRSDLAARAAPLDPRLKITELEDLATIRGIARVGYRGRPGGLESTLDFAGRYKFNSEPYIVLNDYQGTKTKRGSISIGYS